METTTYTICGHTFAATKVATCSGNSYTNFAFPQSSTSKNKQS